MTEILQPANQLKNSFIRKRSDLTILLLCWSIVQSGLLYYYGIFTDLEARKYIDEANFFLNTSSVTSSNYWSYFIEIFLIATVLKLKVSFIWVYFVQLIFNWIATKMLYNLICNFEGATAALIISLFFIFNIPLQTFNSFLQTESLFFSFSIIFSCYLLKLKSIKITNYGVILLFLILLSFTRPTGIFFIPATFLYLLYKFLRPLSIGVKVGISSIVFLAFLFFLNIVLGSGGGISLIWPFRDERVICGIATTDHPIDIKTTSNPNSIWGLFYFITHNFSLFSRLAWLKSKAFFGLYKPYYSFIHNLYLFLYFFPFYILVIASLKKWFRKNKPLLIYCFSIITIIWCSVVGTCDDWHNRFYFTIIPPLYILSAPTVKTIIKKVKSN